MREPVTTSSCNCEPDADAEGACWATADRLNNTPGAAPMTQTRLKAWCNDLVIMFADSIGQKQNADGGEKRTDGDASGQPLTFAATGVANICESNVAYRQRKDWLPRT
jgi:hypothetical protein